MASGGNRDSASSRVKILVDMNLSPLWVGFLADRGYESVHWSEIGKPSAPDHLILDYATAHN